MCHIVNLCVESGGEQNNSNLNQCISIIYTTFSRCCYDHLDNIRESVYLLICPVNILNCLKAFEVVLGRFSRSESSSLIFIA